MHWTGWIVAALGVITGGWMAFDGSHALIIGDYVTPKTGAHAGQLGPWAGVVKSVCIAPRSALMKWIFIIYGGLYLSFLTGFLLKASWAWLALLITAIAGLWYVPFGTLCNLIVIILLLLPGLRAS